MVEKYVRNCAFAKDRELDTDPTEIICESFTTKKGRQGMPSPSNPMELVVGNNYFKNKKRLFEQVVGFAKFSEFLVVANVSDRYPLTILSFERCPRWSQRGAPLNFKCLWMEPISRRGSSLRT